MGDACHRQKFTFNNYLDYRLRDRLLGTRTIGYANIQGLYQLVERAEDQLLDAEQRASREYLEKFYSRLRDEDVVAYGSDGVEKAIKFGAVDIALAASTVPRERRQELEVAVAKQGRDLYVVSRDTERGSRFADTFGGVGALLRFPVN